MWILKPTLDSQFVFLAFNPLKCPRWTMVTHIYHRGVFSLPSSTGFKHPQIERHPKQKLIADGFTKNTNKQSFIEMSTHGRITAASQPRSATASYMLTANKQHQQKLVNTHHSETQLLLLSFLWRQPSWFTFQLANRGGGRGQRAVNQRIPTCRRDFQSFLQFFSCGTSCQSHGGAFLFVSGGGGFKNLNHSCKTCRSRKYHKQ